MKDFLRAIEGERVPLADGWAGVLAVEVAQAVYRASEEHSTVTLPRS